MDLRAHERNMEISRKGAGGIRVAGNFNWKLFARWCTRFDLEVGLCNRVGAGADLVFEGYKRCYKFLKREILDDNSFVNILFDFKLVEFSIKCFIHDVYSYICV